MSTSSEMASTRTEAFCIGGPTAIGIEKKMKMRSQSQAKRLCFEWMGGELLRHKYTD